MKRRFLLIIGAVLVVAIGSVGVLQYILFRAEQFRLLDSRIESTATLLISSNLSKSDLKDFDEAEEIISEVVGGEKFNQFIIVYRRTGEEVYRSANAEILPEKIPKDEKWQTIDLKGHLVRVLTLPLGWTKGSKSEAPQDTRILQTGLILDEDLLRMKTVSRNVIVYSVLLLILIFMTTFWVAEALLRPLKELAAYLRHMSGRLEVSPDMTALEPPPPSSTKENDEFGQLVTETKRLRDMIGRGLKNTQAWTAQMAHEMKTPLTVLQNNLESALSEPNSDRAVLRLKEATAEIDHLNSLINSFLEWSAAENFPELSEELHAVRLGQLAKEIAEKFSRQHRDRISLVGDSNLRVFAKRGFAYQAVSNLITNALKYSPAESRVQIRVSENAIEILDHGAGIPVAVLDHLGEPFNYGAKGKHGFGLGLAWVETICRKYRWKLSFNRERHPASGSELDEELSAELEVTIAKIQFPKDD